MSVPKDSFADRATTYAVLHWKYFKLNRVSHSSLNAENYTAAAVSDAVEFAETFWVLIQDHTADALGHAVRLATPHGLVTDAKSAMHGAAFQRTAVELPVL